MATLGFVLKRLAAQRLLALALVITLGFTIGVLVAGPIYADAAREAILSSEVLVQPVTVKSVRFRTDGGSGFVWDEADGTIETALSDVPVDLIRRQGRVTAGLSSVEGTTVSLPLVFRDEAEDQVDLRGEFPDGPGEVALPRGIARQLRADVGDLLTLTAGGGATELTVTGIFPPFDSENEFWFGSLTPFPAPDSTAPSPALVTREAFLAIDEELGVFPEYVWDVYLALLGTPFAEVELVPSQLQQAQAEMQRSPALARVTSNTGVASLVGVVRDRTENLRVPIYLVVFQIGAVALAVLAGVSQLALSRQSFELAVLKSRGFSRKTLLGAQTVQTLATALVAYPVGLGLGIVLAKLAIGANGPSPEGVIFPTRLSTAALAAGVAGAVVGGIILLLTSLPYVSRTVIEERRSLSREDRPLLARYPWEIFVAILGFAAFYEVRTSGFLPTQERGSLDPLVLLAPTLLLFAASFAVLRVLLLLFRWLDRSLGRVSSLPAYLAGRRLGRSPGTSFATSLLLVLAAGLLVVSTSYRGIVVRNHEDAAHQNVGGDWRIEIASPEHPLASLARLPEGSTPIVRTDMDIPIRASIRPVALGIDPSTYAEGGWWRTDFGDLTLDQLLQRLESPRAGVALPEGTELLEVNVTSPFDVTGLLLHAMVERPDRSIVPLDLGPLTEGAATYRGPVPNGTRLLSLTLTETPDAPSPEVVRVRIDSVDAVADDARLSLDLTGWEAIPWRGSTGETAPAADGLDLTIDPGSSHTVGGVRPPEPPMPAVVSTGFAPLGEEFSFGISGQSLRFRRVATIRAFPTTLGEFVLLPAPALLERSRRLPDATLGFTEVWAMGGDPTPGLRRGDFFIGREARDAESQITILAQLPQSLAVGMHFTAATGGMGLVIIGVAAGLYFAQRRREFEFAALRAMGVDGRQVTWVLLLEQAVLIGFAVVAGFALGLGILRLMMPYVGKSLGAAFPAPVLVVDWSALGAFGVAILGATTLGLVMALRALLRSSVTSVLRGEAE